MSLKAINVKHADRYDWQEEVLDKVEEAKYSLEDALSTLENLIHSLDDLSIDQSMDSEESWDGMPEIDKEKVLSIAKEKAELESAFFTIEGIKQQLEVSL